MLTSEEEAKGKWCPMGRSIITLNHMVTDQVMNLSSANRGLKGEPIGMCLGSGCMAFRFRADCVLQLGNGMVSFLDEEDKDLAGLSWWWDGSYVKGPGKTYLHRLIVSRAVGEIPKGMVTDHIDGDGLNNRRGNLRLATRAQNSANAAPRGGASKYRGVFKGKGKWCAQIAKGGVRISLGSFDTEEEAAAAYDETAKSLHGQFARLNLSPVMNSGRLGYCGLAGKPYGAP